MSKISSHFLKSHHLLVFSQKDNLVVTWIG